MNKFIAAAAVAATVFTAGAAQAESKVQVGTLTCDVAPGIGYIIGSSKDVECKFTRKGYKTETYDGSISKLGIDLGITGGGKLVWLVFAATKDVGKRALAGNYVGATAEVAAGVGAGANALVGGNKVVLNPISVTGDVGINLAAGIADLDLVYQGQP